MRQLTLDDLGAPLYDVTFCVLDLETTGGSPRTCSITEIGAVKYRGGELVGSFATLVNPGVGIPPFITILTGITQQMVVAAPPIEAALPPFLEFCRGTIIVGHNVRFDLSFLDSVCRRLDYPLVGSEPAGRRHVDTVGLARRLIRPEVRDLTLATLARHFRSPFPPIHRALEDARATAHVFHALLERAGTIGITGLDELLLLPTARGSSYYQKLHLTEGLPRSPGVYMFFDRNEELIYVGKADNLRTRVRSYFYGDERRRIGDLLRQLHRVEYRVCAHSLESEITELRLIHAQRPRFNQRSRPPRRTLFVRLTEEQFPRLSIAHNLASRGRMWLGPFRSKRAADLVVEALWASTQLRRCTGRAGSRQGLCAPGQMGVALCPCAGGLSADLYAQVIDTIVGALGQDPGLVLDPIAHKMRRLASERRFEEAAQMRDRHRALARALERARAWQALSAAGRIELESNLGERVVVDQGRLVAAWRAGQTPPLLATPIEPDDGPPAASYPVPPTMDAAEEAHLIWQWMTGGRVRVIESSGPLVLPAAAIPHLSAA
ncbi:MAG TPA: DEDD exonuclease domain-containing protein [Acidimicrobiia bacterium]|nr:DEDD exonuclease domain-containing protein [Acidimicrobiia bacterium]